MGIRTDGHAPLTALGTFFLLLSFALALRLPFFFPAVIDWDESTYILMGQALLDGHLPYVKFWSFKPPLTSASFAMFIAAFGRDIIGIRLAGTLCVVAAAFLTYLATVSLFNRRTGILAAMLCVATMSLVKGGQATMTEHVAVVPLLAAFCILVRRGPSTGVFLLAGMLLATASMVRTNLAFVAALVGIYVLVASRHLAFPRIALHATAYVGAGLSIVAATLIPYALVGEHALWWTSVVSAGLSYSNLQNSVTANMINHGAYALGFAKSGDGFSYHPNWLMTFIAIGGAAGFVYVLRTWHRLETRRRRGIAVLIIFVLGTGFSILKTGPSYPHYLLQLVPFAVILVAAFLHESLSGRLRLAALSLVVVLTVLSMRPIGEQYGVVGARMLAHKDLRFGAAYDIAAFLKRENPAARQTYLLTDHIAYWFTQSYPPTQMTWHPSNIGALFLLRPFLGRTASTEQELRRVFRTNPEFIVTPARLPEYLAHGGRVFFEEELASRYALVEQIEGRKIYRRQQQSPLSD